MTETYAYRPLRKEKSVKMQQTNEAGCQKAGKPKKGENMASLVLPANSRSKQIEIFPSSKQIIGKDCGLLV